MALMSPAERREAYTNFCYNTNITALSVIKPEIFSAIDAVDTYMDSIAATIRNQIDAGVRAKLDNQQTRALIRAIMQARYG